jgi:hypothetical protein
MTDKGFDLPGLVRTLVAMRRAGLLVHAYLIYGFPGQPRSDIADSAELCRQLFASGLVDSAFWHRFVLTRHSRMSADWKAGKLPNLKPVDKPWDFANNDLGFAGEGAFDEFDGPLSASLEAWMSGEGLDEAYPGSSVPPDLILSLIEKAEAELDAARLGAQGRARWIAGLPATRPSGKGKCRLAWTYRGEARSIEASEGKAAFIQGLLESLAIGRDEKTIAQLAAELGLFEDYMKELRESGLIAI